MSIFRSYSVAFLGMQAHPVEVQSHLEDAQLYKFTIVGLADKAVDESKERIRAALSSIGLALPHGRIVVNLAPADLTKMGSHFDLPIALSLMGAMGLLFQEQLDRYVSLGELGLDGIVAPVVGVLPAAIHAQSQERGLICAKSQAQEALYSGNPDVIPINGVMDLVQHFRGKTMIAMPQLMRETANPDYPDLADVKAQHSAKRAVEIAAAGGHHLLMTGPPGSGKSMLAARLPGILPPLSSREMLEVSMVASVAGKLKGQAIVNKRPYAAPHHSASMASLVGGGRHAKPGEITLAHHGVLFLDELPEFARNVLDALRQPIETGEIHVARAEAHVTYPAKFLLVAAMNPCKCGYFGNSERQCHRVPHCMKQYQSKLSGPLLDRFDLAVDVPAISLQDLKENTKTESSSAVLARVCHARERQRLRYLRHPIEINAHAAGKLLEETASLEPKAQMLIEQALERLKLSMRSYARITKVARTIADLEGSEAVKPHHVSEAVGFRKG